MKLFYKLFVLFFCFLALYFSSFSQNLDNKIKVQYIYRFSENINWEKQSLKDTFHIGYLGEDQDLINYLKLIEGRTIHNYPTKVIVYNSLKNINLSKLHLIYIDNKYELEQKKLFNMIAGKNILLISDNIKQQKFVMINFIYSSNKTISFEVNRKTILDQNLKINPKLLLLGGKEIDIRELYKQQEEELDKEREQVVKQRKEIKKLNSEISAKLKELKEKSKIVEEKEKELIKQQAQINEQKNMLSKIKNEVNNSKYQLNQKILDLKAKETEIELQKTIISQQTEKVEEAKKELSSLNIEIEEKQNELKDKENEIAEKEEQLDVKDTTIDTQKQWMIIGGIVLLIILILSISLAKMIKDRNKRNKELNEKNNEISNKNVEINTQKEELLSQKEYIETQLQQTQASIDYAQTIQNAILPRKIVMSEFFENIVLFRPKDIVSGDFYWFTHLPAKNGYSAKTFFATVDCTGHGVPGAFMSMIGNRLLNEIINEKKILDTAKILDALDAAIKKSLKQAITSNRDGMDMCICKIEELETKQYEVMYSGAKRPLYYYNSKENKLSKLAVDRKSIGGSIYRKSAKNKFTHKKIKVLANDIIYLTTDGYIDQNDLNRKRMGSIKFEAILSDIVTKTIQEQANILNHELDKHMQSAKQRDDITLLAIKF